MNLYGLNTEKIHRALQNTEHKEAYRAKQLFSWLYGHRCLNFSEMSNFSKPYRQELERQFQLQIPPILNRTVSRDKTMKYAFGMGDNPPIESVYIPETTRSTLCISSQIGCKFRCRFCATGSMRFFRNLSSGEILGQLHHCLKDHDMPSNIVFMGMGEPLDNLDNVLQAIEIMTHPEGFAIPPRKITVSTVGVVTALERLWNESKVNLAISLHAPDDEIRSRIMPINRKHNIDELLSACKRLEPNSQRPLRVEYLLLNDINDQPQHARMLIKKLHGIPCKVNLLSYHQSVNPELEPSPYPKMQLFQKILLDSKIPTSIRKSRGQDIDAACGMLSTRMTDKKKLKSPEPEAGQV